MLATAGSLGRIFLPDPVNRQHPRNQGLVAWWLTVPGWEGGRQIYDLMGLNHGTLTSMAAPANGWSSRTHQGGFGSLLFDGSAGYVVASVIARVPQLTAASWVCPTATNNGYQGVISQTKPPDNPDFVVGLSNNNNAVFRCNLGGWYASSAVIPLNSWSCIAVTYDGAHVAWYVNGKPDNTFAIAGSITSNASTLHLGDISTSTTQRWAGYLNDIAIWNRALSAAEVWADYEESQRGRPETLNWLSGRFFSLGTVQNFLTLTAGVTVSGSIVKQIQAPLSASSATGASLTRQPQKLLSAASTTVATFARGAARTFTASSATALTLTRLAAKSFTAASATVASVVAAKLIIYGHFLARVVRGARGDRGGFGGGRS